MSFVLQDHSNATYRPGFVLPGILIVILLMTMAVYSFSEQMINDLEFSVAQQHAIQRRCSVDSGVAYIAALSRTDDWNRDTQDDAERLFRNIPISESDQDWQFSIVVPRTVRNGLIRYGVVDESAKLDINHLAVDETGAKVSRQRLLAIPGMTEQASDSILDWLDEDAEPRPNGAERNYSHSLGLEGMPRRYQDYLPRFHTGHAVSTVGSWIMVSGILLMFYNLWRSYRKGPIAGDNPWGATTLEWKTSSPPPLPNFRAPPAVTTGPYDFHAILA